MLSLAYKQAHAEIDKALKLCRGCYQRDIVNGYARISGSDLKGKAKKYGIHYENSRNRLFARMYANEIEFAVYRPRRGPHKLVYGERFCFLARVQDRLPVALRDALIKATESGRHYKRVRALVELALDDA